ncbi:MAG: hypothetical protein IJ105_05730 [Bacilli bacterium]|nr:hypothetical protein [Bacilli bacterium]
MNNIICIGNLSYNKNLFVNSYPIENHTTTIVKKYKSIGNNLNIPIILSKYNLNVYYFSNVGNDYEGKEIINYLKTNNINTYFINILKNTKTNKKYIIRNIKNNTKTILSERINNKYNLSKSILFKPNIIYNDTYNIDLVKQIKNKYKDINIITNLNEISTNALNVCSISDYIIIPIKYAQILTNVKLDTLSKRSIIDLYLKTKRLFSGKIIIYIENLGCIYEKDNIVNIIPKLGDKNKMSNNSYDIFISTIIYGISRYFSLEKNLKIATISKFLSDNNKQNLNINEVIDIYEKNN